MNPTVMHHRTRRSPLDRRWTMAAAVLTVAAVLVPAHASEQASARATGRAMTIDDLIGAVRVADPQLSPDGRSVAFVRTTTNLETGARNADIWIVPSDGSGASRLLIGGDKSENT